MSILSILSICLYAKQTMAKAIVFEDKVRGLSIRGLEVTNATYKKRGFPFLLIRHLRS